MGPASRPTKDAQASSLDSPVPILIVDDNAAKRFALQAILSPLGYSIVEADSCSAALRCVLAQDFAVILLDVRMPTTDGFETAALIRQRQQSEMTPIIFITAQAKDEIVSDDLYAQGAVDFIFAPVPPDELRAKVSVFANLFRRAEELATRARVVQASADQLRLLADAAPIGIFQTDIENRYVYTNPRWSEITGISPEEAVGRVWGPSITLREPVDPDEWADHSRRVEIEVAGSAPRIVVATSKAIPDGAGGTAGWVGTLADVTAEAGAEAALADARDKATEASRIKSDFLANMSHEIRTPMNGLIGMTDLLLETELDADQRDYAQTVRNSGEALLTIINDILDFSKVEAGKLDIEDIGFDVRTIVHDVIDLLVGDAQGKGLELLSDINPSVPPSVGGDPGRVRQVLTNLIANAIKFTQTGEIVVRVFEFGVTEEGIVLRFEVSDTGDGIEADKLSMIFEPFVQADASTSRKHGGTGLGLAISTQLVALMGGDCGASSRRGEGSDFWFTVRVRTDAGPSVHRAPSLDPALAGLAALVVDDNATQRRVLSGQLGALGMIADTADSGPAAIRMLRAAAAEDRPYAVTLVDRSMPGMDGLQLRDQVDGDPSLTTRLVLMSGLGQHLEQDAVEASGISACLKKPIHRDDLWRCMREAMGMPAPAVIQAEATSGPGSRTRTGETGRLLLAEDNAINRKVAVAMLSSAGYRVDTVPNGAAAVEAAAAPRYDAILMDCQMPELNGYEATAAIRALEGSARHTPIIAMTAGARPEDRERCLSSGMDSYLAKPVSKDMLLTLVARCLRNGSSSAPTADRATGDEITIDTEVFDDLRILEGSTDRGFLAGIVEQFTQDTGPLLVEIADAIRVDDALAVGRIAHSLKGSCVQLGGRRLALSCDRLEAKAASGRSLDVELDLREVETDFHDLCRALAQQLRPVDLAGPSVTP